VVKFQKYKVADSTAIRYVYSLLRTASLGAKALGHLKMLVNEPTLPDIMGKMPVANWKQWAVNRPI
jgi:hypothetical protein